jgi:dihydropyrimidinase
MGSIAIGSDADLVIFDPGFRGTVSMASHLANNDYSGFDGFELDGRARTVLVRGRVQVEDGVFVGERTAGRFLRREPEPPGAPHAG